MLFNTTFFLKYRGLIPFPTNCGEKTHTLRTGTNVKVIRIVRNNDELSGDPVPWEFSSSVTVDEFLQRR